MAKQGLRTLAFAYADFVSEAFDKLKQETKDLTDFSSAQILEFTLIGLVGLLDRVKEEVPQVIEKIKEGHIDVRLISGESLETCKQTAIQCGILIQNIDAESELEQRFAMNASDFRDIVGVQR